MSGSSEEDVLEIIIYLYTNRQLQLVTQLIAYDQQKSIFNKYIDCEYINVPYWKHHTLLLNWNTFFFLCVSTSKIKWFCFGAHVNVSIEWAAQSWYYMWLKRKAQAIRLTDKEEKLPNILTNCEVSDEKNILYF